ncbi:hypothetical protein [Paraburkholderia sp. 32]|uniref:hypothetical protein n=1 Tax=unclassified Paraburkholderia TaxID=2615204 RepID=UPI003D206FB3
MSITPTVRVAATVAQNWRQRRAARRAHDLRVNLTQLAESRLKPDRCAFERNRQKRMDRSPIGLESQLTFSKN